MLHRDVPTSMRAQGLRLVAVTLLCATLPATATGAEDSPASTQASFRDCAECPEMVPIPAGRFMMGVAPGEEARENLDDAFRRRSEPRREIAVPRFAAGRYEVTRGQYRAFAQATGREGDGCFVWNGIEFALDPTRHWHAPGYAQNDAHPVTCVSWDDASAYVQWLSRSTGERYRLLSEAEWEYAARAGTATTRYWGDDVHSACDYANGADRSTQAQVPGARTWPVANCDDGHAYTAAVGRYRANAFGLHDMLGNVEEWTEDCWNADYRATPNDGRPAITGDCFMRSVRGGSWIDAPVGVRAAYRVGSPTVIRVYRRGFRVGRDL